MVETKLLLPDNISGDALMDIAVPHIPVHIYLFSKKKEKHAVTMSN